MTRRTLRIGLLGHFADANRGDDACPRALLGHLGKALPEATVVLFCMFPKDAADQFHLPAYPVHRTPDRRRPRPAATAAPPAPTTDAGSGRKSGFRAALKAIPGLRPAVRLVRRLLVPVRLLPAEVRLAIASWRRLRNVDLLIVTGSNPIFDHFGGFWNYPFTLWKWTTLARMTGCKLAFASVGAGPIVSARSGRLLVRVLNRADLVAFRDWRSLDLMRSHGYRGRAEIYPDLAMDLPVEQERTRSAAGMRVGINPMPVQNRVYWPEDEIPVRDKYTEALAALASHLMGPGADVYFYGTQADDRVTAGQVQEALRRADPDASVPDFVMPDSVDALTRLYLESDLLVTTRYHGAVFAALTARPMLAICYQGKTREVMETAGVERFAVDFEDVTAERLIEAIERLQEESEQVRQGLEKNAVRAREALEDLYSRLAQLARSRNADGTGHGPDVVAGMAASSGHTT